MPTRACLAVVLAVLAADAALPAAAESLYQPGQYQPLVADRRAYRPGDVLTVQVYENSSAQSTADTTTKKDGSLNLSLKTPAINKAAGAQLSDDFNGTGKTQRTGKLLAQFTVVVQGVDANGLLIIKGQQLIDVNDEKQEIRLEGKVRPIDIADNNTILSTRIADARISYMGDGVLGEHQRPGILTRILSWLGIL
ncbi:MAG TPA: flagellar basal body L-ring protein FlgH [Burkholderiales bacterium]